MVKLAYLNQRAKLRLLEWKGRSDLLIYVMFGSPELHVDEIARYPAKQDWETVFSRSVTHPQADAHVAKFVRAVAHAQTVCRPFEGRGLAMPISGDLWVRIANIGTYSIITDTSSSMMYEFRPYR